MPSNSEQTKPTDASGSSERSLINLNKDARDIDFLEQIECKF